MLKNKIEAALETFKESKSFLIGILTIASQFCFTQFLIPSLSFPKTIQIFFSNDIFFNSPKENIYYLN